MTKTRVTPEKWETYKGTWWYYNTAASVPAAAGPTDLSGGHDEKVELFFVTGESARLAVAALNAISALNPTDPLAAAQHLEGLVEAVQRCVVYYFEDWSSDWGVPNRMRGVLENVRTALSRVTGT